MAMTVRVRTPSEKKMPYITQINKDSEWIAMGKTFIDNAAANSSVLGLTAAQVTGLTASFDLFDTSFSELEAQKAALESAVVNKDKNRDSFETLVRRYSKQFRGNNAIPDATLALLNVAPHSTPRSQTSPTQPLALVATTNSVGQVFLTFKRNGNISGTTFWIQSKSSEGDDWATIETTTRSKITIDNFAPGSPAWFRVVAVRRGIRSAPSNSATIYNNGEERSLAIAA